LEVSQEPFGVVETYKILACYWWQGETIQDILTTNLLG
jgi:hypothetical protein